MDALLLLTFIIMNVGKGSKIPKGEKDVPQRCLQTIIDVFDNNEPDIFFCQEARIKRKMANEILSKYKYTGNKEASILYDSSKMTFSAIDEQDIKKLNYPLSKVIQERMHIGIMKFANGEKCICVSWHGRHKKSAEVKAKQFKSLIHFLDYLGKEKGLPYIVGGDFNIDFTFAESLLEHNFNFKKCKKANAHKGKKQIDFFLCGNDFPCANSSTKSLKLSKQTSAKDPENIFDHSPVRFKFSYTTADDNDDSSDYLLFHTKHECPYEDLNDKINDLFVEIKSCRENLRKKGKKQLKKIEGDYIEKFEGLAIVHRKKIKGLSDKRRFYDKCQALLNYIECESEKLIEELDNSLTHKYVLRSLKKTLAKASKWCDKVTDSQKP